MGPTKKLFSKLDWFSGVFSHISINDLLQEFSVYFSPDVDYMINHRYISYSKTGYAANDQVIEIIEGVQVRVPLDQIGMLQELSDFNLFDTPEISLDLPLDDFLDFHWSRMMFSCSGRGLDNLRELGYNVDENLRNFFPNLTDESKGRSFHVTRADFAFDFINWGIDLPVEIDNLLHQGDLRKGLWYGNNKNPLITESRISSKQATVYIGNSGGSNKILRIYDKLQQYERNLSDNVPLEYRGENGEMPVSWVRIELQSRRDVADSLLRGIDVNTLTSVDTEFWDKRYWCGVLKWIGEYYAPRLRFGEPIADFWITLFDWSLIEKVIQNAKYVSSKTRLERAESFAYRNFFSTLTFISHVGLEKYLCFISDTLEQLQKSQRWDFYYSRLCSSQQLGSCLPPSFLDKDVFGLWRITDLTTVINYLRELNGYDHPPFRDDLDVIGDSHVILS